MNTLVTGATGLIGRRLVRHFVGPKVLARNAAAARAELGDVEAIAWDAARPVPEGALRGVDTVFHLAGEPVAGGRLTDARKARIRETRVEGTRQLVAAIRASETRPKVLVCASAVGIYGSRGDETLTEDSAPGHGFLAEVCRAWEHEALEAEALGVRVVCARIGIVIGRDGGALAAMLPIFRAGLGGPLGSGKQWMPWIHVDDVVGLLRHAAEHQEVRGPLNVCGPGPVQNRDFARALGGVLERPAILRAPAIALRLALGDLADVVLASQRVLPAKAWATGYRFRFVRLDDALYEATHVAYSGHRPHTEAES